MDLQTAIDVRLDAGVEAPGTARRLLQELNGALSPGRANEARLLVSEVVTNAVMYAAARGGIRLVVRIGPDRLRVEVRDAGEGFEPVRPPLAPAPGRAAGRGLYLVEQVARRWGNARTSDGHCVWFELGRG